MGAPGRSAVALAVLGGAVACAHGVDATGVVVEPPLLEVRIFPRIVVASPDDPNAIRLATALALHLEETGPNDVRLVSQAALEPMRLAGQLPPASAVVLVELEIEHDAEARWLTRPETICGPVNCYTTRRSYLDRVPIVRARVVTSVFEGPTARLLEGRRFGVTYEGHGLGGLEERALEELARRIVRAVDAHPTPVPVTLPRFEAPGADDALARIAAGAWDEGRRALERVVRTADFAALSAEQRARGWYALGLARRFDPSTLTRPERHFALARRALLRAQRLDPRQEHARAIGALDRHRDQLLALVAQREAARRNFDYARTTETLPAPPDSYLSAPPPPAGE